MKVLLSIVTVFTFTQLHSQTVNIPDKNFEKALISLGIDSDKTVNGKVLRSDVLYVKHLDLYNKKIRNLKGIEAFTSLTYLDCRRNYLSRVNLTYNIALNALYTDLNDISELPGDPITFNYWMD